MCGTTILSSSIITFTISEISVVYGIETLTIYKLELAQ